MLRTMRCRWFLLRLLTLVGSNICGVVAGEPGRHRGARWPGGHGGVDGVGEEAVCQARRRGAPADARLAPGVQLAGVRSEPAQAGELRTFPGPGPVPCGLLWWRVVGNSRFFFCKRMVNRIGFVVLARLALGSGRSRPLSAPGVASMADNLLRLSA